MKMEGEYGFVDIGETGNLSSEDIQEYMSCIVDAFAVHVDREKIRHGLWKQAGLEDQIQQIRIKSSRVLHSIELRKTGALESEEFVYAVGEELVDIINYAVFALRISKGEFGEQ